MESIHLMDEIDIARMIQAVPLSIVTFSAQGDPFNSSYPIYGTEEFSTVTIETTDDFYTSMSTSTDDDITTKHSNATSPQTASTRPPERPGRAVFTIVTTVKVDGAMEDATLRENVFEALENDLLIPALDKVQGYVEVGI